MRFKHYGLYYGRIVCGADAMRVKECLRLRLKDVDLSGAKVEFRGVCDGGGQGMGGGED